jgi:hypothetical protein
MSFHLTSGRRTALLTGSMAKMPRQYASSDAVFSVIAEQGEIRHVV